jgi:hypothetical protein
MRQVVLRLGFVLATLAVSHFAWAELPDDALAAAKKVTTFYWQNVSTDGGYLWRYSADLKLREGEGKVERAMAWVQPPGTPAMGEAYVRLYEATGDKLFLDAALAAADVLRRGQLRSGGWPREIELDSEHRRTYAYRIDKPTRKPQRNYSSLDDDQTQSALRFLMRLDRALEFKNDAVHEMSSFALDGLLKAQFPNGSFPQGWDRPHHADDLPIKPASFPDSWPREYPGHQNYWDRYTLNDDLMPDLLTMLFQAEETYGDKKYRQAALKSADFLLLAQLPEPQPAWAQQYNAEMQPIWARKFEPPAVSGGESQGILRALMEIYRRTGDRKYLEPIPRALVYLKKSRLPDGRLARFYELKTNRPLYFTREYKLTYDDTDLPTHYGFKVPDKLDQFEREYQALLKSSPEKIRDSKKRTKPSGDLVRQVKEVVGQLDERGAWVTDSGLRFHKVRGPTIDMEVAVRNLNLLADYLESAQ